MVHILSEHMTTAGRHRDSTIWTDNTECDLCDQERDCLIITVDMGDYTMVRICLECLGQGLMDMSRMT
jgi:hypothetical protein